MSEQNELLNDNEMIDASLPDVPPEMPVAQSPNKIFLKDYTPPDFAIRQVDLDIRLFADHALVLSRLHLVRSGQDGQGVSKSGCDLFLHGQDLTLLSIRLDGQDLPQTAYRKEAEGLWLFDAPDDFVLETEVRIVPQKNTTLEGLYQAGEGADAMFVTQCEPEGFRKITFYLDRPDVLARFRTRLEADLAYPTLLANGNLLESGNLEGNRHYAIWDDPTKKPSYLFACVMADLAVLRDSFITSEGREVLLEVYAKDYDIEKCHLGMQALKDAMAWDEKNYGRAYDLDRYMIVAVSQFNMGAMENKGLNIFNTACVLSSPETTTDARSFNVKAVIAHEYFHNWTGNRITCRDWFQLCLKEGFTVYRDQSFSADQQSAAVQRIDDVALLQAHQFPEDASPLAHPVRPESFVEINNFYTTTVYEKGAEIVRMIANFLGKEKFRQGTDEYFRRYDGQAVTVEDFLSALSVTKDVMPFLQWYKQPATPVVSGYQDYNAETKTLTVTLTQKIRHVAGYEAPKALPIPVASAVFAKETGEILAEKILLLAEDQQTFVFENIDQTPVLSLLRDFSAPVQLQFDHSDEDLAFLLMHETNGFNRWQAVQRLVNKILLQNADHQVYLASLQSVFVKVAKQDPQLAARLLDVPSESELSSAFEHNYDPKAVKIQRDDLIKALAHALKPYLADLYLSLPIQPYTDTPASRGERALRNALLNLALTAQIPEAQNWAENQYQNAVCMTERLGALQAMINHNHPKTQDYLHDFYQKFQAEKLVIDLWFSAQANSKYARIADLNRLIAHPDFDWNTPNRIRAVINGLANQPTQLWTKDGLALLTATIARLDKTNPVLAARLLQPLARWDTLIEPNQTQAKNALQSLRQQANSKNVLESLEGILKKDGSH